MDVEKPERYEGEESPMDTGAPPGVHPNSDAPDPEVVEQADAASEDLDEEELHERYGAGAPPSGPEAVEEPADPDAASGHGPSRD